MFHRQRWRIALLTLGVVVGYGSAFAQFMHARHDHGYHCDHYGFGSWYDHDRDHDHAAPSKSVQ
jgi:hypothetical protein